MAFPPGIPSAFYSDLCVAVTNCFEYCQYIFCGHVALNIMDSVKYKTAVLAKYIYSLTDFFVNIIRLAER